MSVTSEWMQVLSREVNARSPNELCTSAGAFWRVALVLLFAAVPHWAAQPLTSVHLKRPFDAQ